MSEPTPPTVVARRVVVHGYVQGVFFRESTRREAERRGVAGWVANRTTGTVEALLEGRPEDVERMISFFHRGPRGARVDRVQVQECEPQGLRGFRVH